MASKYADEEVEDSFLLQGIISSSKHLRPWKNSLSTLLPLLQWLSIDINAPYNTVILTSTLYHHRHPCQHLLLSTSSPGISMARRKDSPKDSPSLARTKKRRSSIFITTSPVVEGSTRGQTDYLLSGSWTPSRVLMMTVVLLATTPITWLLFCKFDCVYVYLHLSLGALIWIYCHRLLYYQLKEWIVGAMKKKSRQLNNKDSPLAFLHPFPGPYSHSVTM